MKIFLLTLALCLLLCQACASPGQIVEDAVDELAQSPTLTTDLEATPCGLAGQASTSATTSARGVRATATLAIRVEQECEDTLSNNPTPAPIGASTPQADTKEVQ